MQTTLGLIVFLLAAAVLATTLFRALNLPALLGYIAIGVATGPSALGLAPNPEETRHLAEFGVVFLMFSIGLEFSLAKLRVMRLQVFGFGGLQVLLSMLLGLTTGLALGLGWAAGVALGGVLAMSSTAIVSKLLADQNELDQPHGKLILGALLFQDLAVVPLLIFIPSLASGSDMTGELLQAGLKAAIVLGLILILGQKLLRPWFHLVAKRKSNELFMLNVLLITLGLAYATDMAGLSLALGAFVAGVLISETEYRYQVESDIRPFRDVLMGLFFLSIGMLLDLRTVAQNWGGLLLATTALIGAKFILVAALARLWRAPMHVALRTGLGLAQGGEFGLVLLGLTGKHGLIAPDMEQTALAAMMLSMIAAPLLVQYSHRIVRRLTGGEWMQRAQDVHAIAVKSFGVSEHVILCGYGRNGQGLARMMEAENVPFMALDDDPGRIAAAVAAGDNVVFGDSTRTEVLMAAGIRRARAVAITFADANAAIKVLAAIKQLKPGMPVIVRTIDENDLDRLKEAGATEVVPEVLEGALMLGSQTLLMAGVPLGTVLKRIRRMREQRYSSLRGFFSGLDEVEHAENEQERLLPLHIEPGLHCIGKSLGELKLEALGVAVVAVRRRGIRGSEPDAETVLQAGDIVILRGAPEGLSAAEMALGAV